ncbi:hypothetical protein R1flu_009790 [Riccia fluitans]|uniref:Uncharacterized protein n=1 Tax=Riccia fluitans TaxID=41844 RepID=A0ABD1Z393_9MARC
MLIYPPRAFMSYADFDESVGRSLGQGGGSFDQGEKTEAIEMSANVISGFLPWTVEFVKSNARSRQIWDYIFPPEVLEICPAPFHHISIGENVVSIRLWACFWVLHVGMHFHLILAASLYSILSFLALTTTSPMVRDMVYVLPTIACVLFLTHQRMSFRRKALAQKLTGRPDDLRARAAEKGLDIGVIGASLAAGSVVADRWLCHTLGSHGGFLVWVFIGCDISLFGAYKFITTLRSLPPASGVKSKAV